MCDDPPVDSSDRIVVRPAEDEDDLDALNAGNPVWMSEELLRDSVAAAAEDVPIGVFMATLDGAPAGFAAATGAGVCDGHRGGGYLFVRPEFRRNGIGGRLWRSILEVCSPERVPGVLLQMDADDQESRSVALAHGLRAGNLHLESRLDLASAQMLEVLATADVDGVSIRPFGSEVGEGEWRTFGDLFNRLLLDTPDQSGGADPVPLPVLRSLLSEPWQVMGAWQGSEMVGFTSVMVRNRSRRRLNTFLTAIEREYRGRGLSTVLKARHAVALRDAGWASIITHNVDGNAPILASNRRLGFHYSGGVLDVLYDHPAT
jgi:GNAT superfamily N-acetyltransferase